MTGSLTGDTAGRRALIVQHAPEASPGTLEQTLRGRAFDLEWWWAAREPEAPARAGDYDLIVSLGGRATRRATPRRRGPRPSAC
jgi:GMP synthase-like glutamine amidotransferase